MPSDPAGSRKTQKAGARLETSVNLGEAMRTHKRDAVVPRYVAAALRQFATHSVDMKTLIVRSPCLQPFEPA